MRNSSGHAKLAAEYHTPGARGLAFSICAVQMMHSGVFGGLRPLLGQRLLGRDARRDRGHSEEESLKLMK